jgi:hypothetical protein
MRTHQVAVLLAIAAAATLAPACVASNATSCGDLVCPTGTTCAPAGGRCYDTDLVESCRGVDDGDACDVPGLPTGVCQNGVCQTSRCGDGRVTGMEDCDGTDFDGVSCQSLGFYERPGIACSSSCTYDTAACVGRCGDGVKNGPEKCDGTDLGNQSCLDAGFYAAPGLACAADCSFNTASCGGGYCGDGSVNGFEQCDTTAFSATSCAALGYTGALSGLVCSQACTYHQSSCSCAAGHCNAFTQRCECSKTGCACVTN